MERSNRTVDARSIFWFAAGLAVAVFLTTVVVGVRATAAPGAVDSTFVALAPCRLVDTRPGPFNIGTRSTPIGPDETHVQQVSGSVGECTIPVEATAISMNVTAVEATAPSFMTLFPLGQPLPLASNLNYLPGQAPTPNKVDVKIGDDGKIGVYNLAGTVHLVADVGGYYKPSGIDDLQQDVARLQNEIDDLRQRQTFVARVNADGTKAGSGPFTSSSSATGSYQVRFDLSRSNIFASPNAQTLYEPVALATPECPGAIARANFSSFNIGTDGYYDNVGIAVSFATTSNAPIGCRFSLMIRIEDPNPIVLVPV